MTLEHSRIASTDSALIALCFLTPPSPILTTGGLPGACTSGEIPILLDLSVDLDLSPPPSPIAANPPPIMNPLSTGVSTTTIGTFGPIHRREMNDLDSGSRTSWVSWKEATLEAVNSQSTFHCNLQGTQGTPRPSRAVNDLNPESPSSPRCGGIRPAFGTDYDERLLARRALEIELPISPTQPTHPVVPSVTVLSRHNATHQRFSHNRNYLENSDRSLSHLPVSNGDVINGDAIHVSKPSMPKLKPLEAVPSNLLWLNDILVELLIDQEGFRTVKPAFKFFAYSESRPANGEPAEMALFKSQTHQNFHFHYAPLDGLPVLRRITVNGEENKDYISRQASLSLKSNGLYSVGGTENLSHNKELTLQGNDVLRLRWTFEYFIDDRKDISGRVVGGEKTLTPLNFTCSPMLLHHLQGRRVNLMHIVKKSVAPNIVAEKVPQSSSMPRQGMHPDPSAKGAYNQDLSWNLHRRTQSQAGHHRLRTSDDSEVNELPLRTLVPVASDVSAPKNKDLRRRRASSAGEQSRRDLHCMKREPQKSPNIHSEYYPGKHIIRRSQLAELLDACTENIPPNKYTTSPGIQALTPNPHHYKALDKYIRRS
ncbi:hypothetical protein BD779DRAFT_1666767 [Infundibulicybe gibba]|nr:hypothetical protein BD779DRAFT_1666767 [Infundibulicybe gibba]